MKASIDAVGRIVVPKALRDALGLTAGSTVDISRYGAGLQLIPTGRTARLVEDETRSLIELDPGARGTFARVSDSDPEMHRYLAGRDIAPGMELEVLAREPFGGPLTVLLAGREHALGTELARAMRVAVRS